MQGLPVCTEHTNSMHLYITIFVRSFKSDVPPRSCPLTRCMCPHACDSACHMRSACRTFVEGRVVQDIL